MNKPTIESKHHGFEEVMRSEIQMLRETEDQRLREIFDFTGYSEAVETPKKIPQEVKPAKKIPYYHHKCSF